MLFVILTVMLWIMMVLFAHDFVVQGHQNQLQLQKTKIDQGNWHQAWQLDDLTSVVSSFQQDWKVTPNGLSTDSQEAALSLVFEDQLIDPSMHQRLLLEFADEVSFKPADKLRIEFSNQFKQWFFESPELNLFELRQPIDLQQISWQLKRPNNNTTPAYYLEWDDVGMLDGLVLRFYTNSPKVIGLAGIVVQQSKPKQWAKPANIPCVSAYENPWLCLVTNQIRYKLQDWSMSQPSQSLGFVSMMAWPAWCSLLLALGFGVVALKLSTGQLISSASWWLFGLMAVIIILHQQWLEAGGELLTWVVVMLALWLFWGQRYWFLQPKHAAVPLWVGSGLLALLMWFRADVDGQFISDLPQYLLWACWQQLILGPLASEYLQKHLQQQKWVVALTVGVLFSILHTPNHSLMLATLVAGSIWSYSWLSYKNIYANACSHAVLALLFYQFVAADWLGTARIGVFF